MRFTLLLLLFIFALPSVQGQIAYQLGDSIAPFQLQSINRIKWQFEQPQEGFIIVFISPSCPIVQGYMDRLQALHHQYAPLGFPIVAVNSNHASISAQDSLQYLKAFANKQGMAFPYLWDTDQTLARAFGATRTPQCFLVAKDAKGTFRLRYIGAIDDSPRDQNRVNQKYLASALEQRLQKTAIKQSYTRAAGCGIRWAQ